MKQKKFSTKDSFLKDSLFLIQQIEEAFKNVYLPPLEKIGENLWEYDMEIIIAEYWNYHDDWKKISMEVLGTGDELPLFSKEAYPFFLAAYMTSTIKRFYEDNTMLMYLIYDLTWPVGEKEFFDSHKEKESLLTNKQRFATKCFLEFVKRYTDDDEFYSLAEKTLASGIYDNYGKNTLVQ
ncbi:MAG: hypothetical protein LBJ67_07360 [Planctomycetaceae bacterium]|jgi:hypothetical protein|nr:hypothetical protein [Planctomycetaceae bacterium]